MIKCCNRSIAIKMIDVRTNDNIGWHNIIINEVMVFPMDEKYRFQRHTLDGVASLLGLCDYISWLPSIIKIGFWFLETAQMNLLCEHWWLVCQMTSNISFWLSVVYYINFLLRWYCILIICYFIFAMNIVLCDCPAEYNVAF